MSTLMTREEALALKLWQRELVLAERGLKPVAPDYCILWQDPGDIDSPVKITTPAPFWLAMALHGNVLPPVSVYPLAVDSAGAVRPGHGLHEQVIPAMTETGAMEYLLRKDIPARIWSDTGSNRARFKICKRAMVPTGRTSRNAWRLAA